MAPGDNYVSIFPEGSNQPISFVVSLPRNIQWISVQLYIFFNRYMDASWSVLNNGQFVTGNIKLG